MLALLFLNYHNSSRKFKKGGKHGLQYIYYDNITSTKNEYEND